MACWGWLHSLGVALAIIGASLQVQAQAASPDLRYVAPPECPRATEFWQEVTERTNQTLAQDVQLSVHIERSNSGYIARLLWSEPDETMERSVEAAGCAEAASAIALVVALAAQARASATEPSPPPPRAVHPWQWALEADGVLDSGLAPALAWGAGAGVRLGRGKLWQVGLLAGWRGANAEVQQHVFSVELWSLRLQACPLSVSLGSEWQVLACALAEAGSYRARAESGFVRAFDPVYEPWGNAGAFGRAQWQLGARLGLHVSLGLATPLRRRYQLLARDVSEPQGVQRLFEVPTLSAYGSTGLSLSID